jgi:glutaredoxin
MKRLMEMLVLVASLLILASGTSRSETPSGSASEGGQRVAVHLFWTATCPHCGSARRFLERSAPSLPGAELHLHELTGSGENEAAFLALSERHRVDPPAVPLIIVGDEALVGYRDDATTGAGIISRIRLCLASGCPDTTSEIISRLAGGTVGGTTAPASPPGASNAVRPNVPETFQVPFFGTVATRSLSLPVLTVVLAAMDGFNPCAMWVLVLLIGLLVGMKDPVRMWSYGAAFLVTSGAVYFVFMAAWLNAFLLLGALLWIRLAVGLFALAAGAYYLREFVVNRDATCAVTSPGERRRIRELMQAVVTERSFAVALLGIVGLAVAVNAIELLCSAGIPAIYTQVLAMSGLSSAAHYGYLALYIAVFMLDDIAIFITAMLTLQATGLAATYSRFAHLIGGVLLLGIGLLLIARPEWLTLG